MATFVGSQLYHLPLNNWLGEIGVLPQGVRPEGAAAVRTALILGLSAGISETVARVAGYALLFRRRRGWQWEDGLMVGLGHGGIEAMVLGGVLTAATVSSLWSLQGIDLTTLGFTAEQLAAVSQQLALFTTSPLNAFAGLVERAIALGVHVTASLMVWQAFRQRKPLLAVLAALFHALFDATAVFLVLRLGAERMWLIEGIFLLIALPAVTWSWRLGSERRSALASETAVYPNEALFPQVGLFMVALRKELLHQWRTRRVLVVGAVFALFGLLSPVLAYLAPQLLSSIEGAEQFADLVPTPTTADALGQYIRNITQFGFIIAVLLGMGAVAGEKEKGTTAMVLSKPLPRWAFVLSKFVAQAVVYLLGFVLAAVGAYMYTAYLFESLLPGPFLLGNLLLFLWLLTFAAVTLLGSTLANSTGAGAALGLGGAIALLLAGSFPQLGAFAPSALVGWASQLGLPEVASQAAGGNAGPVVANVVIVIVCLVGSVAAFEVQEL
jgi:ABC-2 type transport system permease protein